MTPMKSLAETVRDVAAYAALEDSRFTPVTTKELPLIDYEVSVLSPLRRVTDIYKIKVGKHGLIMKKGDIEGVLLPQVPVEQNWDRDTFIEETCLKAGLPRHAWKDENTDIFMFTALVFSEHSPDLGTVPEQQTAPDKSQPPLPPGLDLPRP
jgi:AmmeMemoRadiSam system protein A